MVFRSLPVLRMQDTSFSRDERLSHMAQPSIIECPRDLAQQWGRLLLEAGVMIHAQRAWL
jgi:hypothetical protein